MFQGMSLFWSILLFSNQLAFILSLYLDSDSIILQMKNSQRKKGGTWFGYIWINAMHVYG